MRTLGDIGKWNKPWQKEEREKPLLHFCPVCGSTEITWIGGLPLLAPHMECKECGHRGIFLLGDTEMIQAVRRSYLEGKEKTQEDETEREDE